MDGGRKWDPRSRTLAVALTTLEDETGQTGHALADELDPDTNGWWEAHVVVNEAVAEQQRFIKEHGKDLEPGAFVIIRDGRVKQPPTTT